METIGQLINGQHVHENHQVTKPIYNPATGDIIKHVEVASSALINQAVTQAKTAFATWSQVPPIKRARILFNYKTLIENNLADLAARITQEHGKTLADAKGSIMRGLEVVEFACNIPALLKGDYSEQVGTDIACLSIRQPLGVCAGITPFNFPAMVPLWMFPLAIACGNTFILKPSERDPGAPMRLVELLYQAGLPHNVVQVLNGDKTTVDTLLAHPDVAAISSVGSTPVAKHIYETATRHGKRVQALGGAKNHAVVLPDADLAFTAEQITGAAFGSTGQRCMAISVVIAVGDKTADSLIALIKQKANDLKLGAGNHSTTDLGPLNNPEALKRVNDYIKLGLEQGADLVVDGRRFIPQDSLKGFFIGPCLFDKVTPIMKIYQDEIFGPVLCVVRVNTLEEAIHLVNQHPYGNGTALFTQSGAAANYYAMHVEVGMVGINVPIPVPVSYHSFGGWKQSLIGDIHMHGAEGVRFYTRMKAITTRWHWDETLESGLNMPSH
jgi:malonate-semialdehyde dehydrogenase (acetylating)/methylmalonate-semialdehyde dehydrogenase